LSLRADLIGLDARRQVGLEAWRHAGFEAWRQVGLDAWCHDAWRFGCAPSHASDLPLRDQGRAAAVSQVAASRLAMSTIAPDTQIRLAGI
jgi:hypothetical protein